MNGHIHRAPHADVVAKGHVHRARHLLVFEHVARIRNLKGHPYEFYQKLGYVIVGVIPDANGPGKPDIIMARRIEADA